MSQVNNSASDVYKVVASTVPSLIAVSFTGMVLLIHSLANVCESVQSCNCYFVI